MDCHCEPKTLWGFVTGFVIALLLYAVTAHRHVGLPDWAVLAGAMSRMELSVAAWNHPLTNILGWLFTRGAAPADFPSRMVWVSILPMAAAVGFFVCALVKNGAPLFLAVICGMIHAVGHSVWWHGTIAENYAVSSLFLCAALFFGIDSRDRKSQIALFVIAGLSLSNHVENAVLTFGAFLGSVPILAASRRSGDRPQTMRLAMTAIVAWLAGASLFIFLFARDAILHRGVVESVLGGCFRQQMLQLDIGFAARRFLDLWTLEYPSPFFAVALAGLAMALLPFIRFRQANTPFRWQCFAIALPVLVFTLTYDAWDRFAFFLPVFTIADFFASMLIVRLWNDACRKVWRCAIAVLCILSIAMPPAIYSSISRWAGEGNGYWAKRFGGIARQYSRRADMVGMLVNPITHDGGTFERHVNALLEAAPVGTVVVDDMAFECQLGWLAAKNGYPDWAQMYFISAVPDFLCGFGCCLRPQGAALIAADYDRDAILTTTNGLCGVVVECLRPYGKRVEPFRLSDGGEAFRVIACEP